MILHKTIHAQQNVQNFGTIIGSNRGTIAYSNQSNEHVSDDPNYIIHNGKTTFTGMKWQCVEYARRWLINQRGISFGGVDYAINLPSIREVFPLTQKNSQIRIDHFLNSAPKNSVKIGVLFIYDTSYAPITGHVAVVVDISNTHIFVAEQNNDNTLWEAADYSRKIPYEKKENVFSVYDEGLISWLRFIKIKRT
jgi:hypothetical protein